jgi:pimeloyl-ACP methyl ester carboxylesterase
MVLPGFMAGERSMSRLVRSLRQAGHDAFGWGLGRNMGVRADLFSCLGEQLNRRAQGEAVTLVGWSLGGLMAREFAKHAPRNIEKILTLGSPFSGDLRRSNHVWRIYRHIAGHDVGELPIAADLSRKPAAETIAFWSPRDGVISAPAARGHPGERDREVRVECSHMAFVWDEAVIRAVAEMLHY